MTSLPAIRTKADLISSSTALALHDPSLAPFLWHTHAGYCAPYTALSRVESMQGGMGGMGMGGLGMGGLGMGGLGMGGLGMGSGGMGMMNPMMMEDRHKKRQRAALEAPSGTTWCQCADHKGMGMMNPMMMGGMMNPMMMGMGGYGMMGGGLGTGAYGVSPGMLSPLFGDYGMGMGAMPGGMMGGMGTMMGGYGMGLGMPFGY
ncbi:hypothetical protein JCM24511_09608 [Saitozyma sp. JCM 24511]|nr:hypothetical protein JCM24511_09608 [Saitozyma sp. JCM 24511]